MFHLNLIGALFVGVFLLESVIVYGRTRHAWTSATVTLFLAFVASTPATAHDYLLHQTRPGAVRYSVRLLAGDPTQECTRACTSWRHRFGGADRAKHIATAQTATPSPQARHGARPLKAPDSLPRLLRWEAPLP